MLTYDINQFYFDKISDNLTTSFLIETANELTNVIATKSLPLEALKLYNYLGK